VVLTSAPLAIKDKIIVGAAGGDTGVRDWMAGLDAATGKRLWQKYTIPAPGEPGSETWKDKNNAWRTGGGAVWVTGTYDPDTNQTVWAPATRCRCSTRPTGRATTFSPTALSPGTPDSGKMNWYFQFNAGDMWDYDEVGTHIMIDGNVGGQPRKLITHSARNGFFYTMERANGAMVSAKPYMDKINWTKGIDQKDRQAARLRIPTRTSKPIQRWPIKIRANRPNRCVHRSLGPTTTGRPLTVRRASGRISRR